MQVAFHSNWTFVTVDSLSRDPYHFHAVAAKPFVPLSQCRNECLHELVRNERVKSRHKVIWK